MGMLAECPNNRKPCGGFVNITSEVISASDMCCAAGEDCYHTAEPQWGGSNSYSTTCLTPLLDCTTGTHPIT